MNNVEQALPLVTAGLFLLQALLVGARSRSCSRRLAPWSLAGFLFLLALFAFSSFPSELMHDLLLFLTLWAAGVFLLQAVRPPGISAWTGVCAAFSLALLLAWVLGYAGSIPLTAYRVFCTIVLSSFLLGLLYRLWRGSRSKLLTVTIVCSLLWAASGATELILRTQHLLKHGLQDWLLLAFSLCTALLVFEEGYPLRDGWNGRLRGLSGADQFARELYARLQATEGALAQQDKLVACGVLALGAAHEFKNVLSLIKTTAQFGLEAADPAKKDGSLRLLMEHVDLGQGSAISLLERISTVGREESRSIDAAKDLAGFLRTLRAAFRAEGVVFQITLAEGIRFTARMTELEQMLLNLVRNSADAYRRMKAGKRVIAMTASLEQDAVVFDVRDEAGGLSEDAAEGVSDGTGLGLYLTRSLALQNGGHLEYLPTNVGSIFRLVFPRYEDEAGRGGK
jgi:signal transduction histidine kinase